MLIENITLNFTRACHNMNFDKLMNIHKMLKSNHFNRFKRVVIRAVEFCKELKIKSTGGRIMNNRRLGILLISLVLIVIIYVGYGVNISTLEANPVVKTYELPDNPVYKFVNRQQSKEYRRTDEIENAINERNMLLIGATIIGFVLIMILGDKKDEDEIKVDNDKRITHGVDNENVAQIKVNSHKYETTIGQENDEILTRDELIRSLLKLKEQGILTEEEFNSKISKI